MRRDDNSVFSSFQQVTGCRYNRAQHNKDLIDTYVLRKARTKGIRLPTGGPPEEYKYLGAHVFTSIAGMSDNVVYIDVDSMYPNLLLSLNASPETVIGTKDDLEASQYTEDDCVWGYIDPRPVKHLEDGERPRDYMVGDSRCESATESPSRCEGDKNGSYKVVYDPDAPEVKWTCDEPEHSSKPTGDGPQYTKLYFKSHETETGFLTECVQELIDLKNQYRGTSLYSSTKRVTNSIYGVLGFATEDSSFRLFDWRIAEAITLCGRKMIQHSADYVVDYLHEQGYSQARVVLGDSVPADETVVIRNEDGNVDVSRIEDLSERAGEIEVWSDDGFTTVRDVIQKPNRKTMYRIRTKNGIVHTTEDHSLVRPDGTEVCPGNLSVGDELLHKETGDALPNSTNIEKEECECRWKINEKRAWLLGLFVADGSCGVYDTETGTTRVWEINKDNVELLQRAADVVTEQFDVQADVRDYRDSSGCYKLKVNGFGNGERNTFVQWFREQCYDGDAKKVPTSVLNGTKEIRTAFLEGYHVGDGYVREKSAYDQIDSMSFRDRTLAQGIAMIVQEAGYNVTIDCRDNHDDEYYRIRTVSHHQGSATEIKSIEEFEYDGEHVYDLETENHHFHAGVGNIIVHNTDGCGVAIPSAATRHEALSVVEEAIELLNNEGYDEFFRNTMGVPPDRHRGVIEVESYAPKVFIPLRNPPHGEIGVKKRRIEWQTWDEDEGECDEIDITGLEAERSDVAPIIKDAQQVFAETLRMDDGEAREYLFPKLRQWAADIRSGEICLGDVCKRGGIGQSLSEYGSQSRRASPLYRGAKYTNSNIDGVTIQQGDKPGLVYIDSVGDDYSRTYDTNTAEDGSTVDAVSVLSPSQLPDSFDVDWEKHWIKSLREPMRPLVETRFGKDAWSQVLHQHNQSDIDSFAD